MILTNKQRSTLTITQAQLKAIQTRFATHETCHGVGDMVSASTVANFNIAMTGKVTDSRPDCMSKVCHAFIIRLQNKIPLYRLNSPAYRAIAPYLAGTGNAYEAERLAIILRWMRDTVLPLLEGVPDMHNYAKRWLEACQESTPLAGDLTIMATDAADWAAAVKTWGWGDAELAEYFWDAVNPEALIRKLVLVSVDEGEMV
jgi:hypothetical protein